MQDLNNHCYVEYIYSSSKSKGSSPLRSSALPILTKSSSLFTLKHMLKCGDCVENVSAAHLVAQQRSQPYFTEAVHQGQGWGCPVQAVSSTQGAWCPGCAGVWPSRCREKSPGWRVWSARAYSTGWGAGSALRFERSEGLFFFNQQ